MKTSKCRSFILGALVLAVVAALSAPAMAQQCSNIISPVVQGGTGAGRVVGDPTRDTTEIIVTFRANINNSCGSGPVNEELSGFIIQPSCNFNQFGACVNDPGQDDGNLATPAVEFQSVTNIDCPPLQAPDTSDPFAVELNFVTPQIFAPDQACSILVTFHVRERGTGSFPTLATIGQAYATNGSCQCPPDGLPAGGSASTQIGLVCPTCDDGNACTDEACNPNTLLCEQGGTTVCTATDTACIDYECDPNGALDNCDAVRNTAPSCDGSDTACVDRECAPGPAGTPYNPNCDAIANTAPSCDGSDTACVDRECEPGPAGTPYNPNCDAIANTAPSCDGSDTACVDRECLPGPAGTPYNPNCDDIVATAPACPDSQCHEHFCVPGPAGTPYDPNCDGSTEISPPPAECVPSEICRITGGGIVCQDGGQCCDITTGACRTQENGESFTCDSDSDCQQNEECRFCTTDGDNASAAIYKATFGGQVGAPFVIPGCHQNDECVQGNWTHQRHKKHGSLHGPSFYNMVCRCEQADGALTPPGTLCNECSGAGCHDPDYPGPEPRPAPANIACFTGTALWNPTSGRRTLNVAFRVEIEDRGEPGGGNNAGNLEDVYRIRIWYADDATEAAELADAACCLNDIASVTTNIGLPNIIDGGNLVHGNLQIHPRTGNPNNTDFPDQCFAGGGEPE